MPRNLLTLAALAAMLALPLSTANAQERASDFGDDVKAFLSSAADDVEDAAEDTFAFFKDKVGDDDDDDDPRFKAPWDR